MRERRTASVVASLAVSGLLGSTAMFAAESAADIPWRPSPDRQWVGYGLFHGNPSDTEKPRYALAADTPVTARPALQQDMRRTFTRFSLSSELMNRMEREFLRYQQKHPHDPATVGAPLDSIAEQQRRDQAERVITRAFDKTMNTYLENVARTSLGMSGLLDWAEGNRGPHLRVGAQPPAPDEARTEAAVARGLARGDFDMDVGFKIDAHPRLVLRSTFLGVQGRIDVPLREQAIRLSLRRSFGQHTRAALEGSWERDGSNWATLRLNFSF